MKLSTVKLLMPMVAVSIQANSATTIIPPYLDRMHIPVALIGTLISLGPVLALLSRLPVGMAYSHHRARLVVSAAMIAMGVTNYLYSFATGPLTFAVVPVNVCNSSCAEAGIANDARIGTAIAAFTGTM